MTGPTDATTQLGRWIEPECARYSDRSGFRLLHTGLDAFVARAALIELAERSLDLQYYIFHVDTTGSIIVNRLRAAADRGVRVRLLLDDFGTLEKNDEDVAGFDAHPKIEIRLFNPSIHRSPLRRLGELLTRFARVNRRMHNKLLIADGQAVVLGGRNIGDEYFALGELDFQDIDVLAVGPIACDAEASFEAYWSSEYAIPISALHRSAIDHKQVDARRRAVRDRVRDLHDSPYAHALAASALASELRAGVLQLYWAHATLLADPPDKLKQPAGTPSPLYLDGQLFPYGDAVQSDLLVVSAYFVPRNRGVEFFTGKSRAGVTVRILTNSLAATDVWLVHAGYMKYRRPLLQRGVRLFELKPEARGAGRVRTPSGSSRASLHGKTFVFDRTFAFVGSINLDPRSLEQNTEVGVLVHSPALAAEVANLFDRWADPGLSYEVRLAGGGRLEWVAREGLRTVRWGHEPATGFWRRLFTTLCSKLPLDPLI